MLLVLLKEGCGPNPAHSTDYAYKKKWLRLIFQPGPDSSAYALIVGLLSSWIDICRPRKHNSSINCTIMFPPLGNHGQYFKTLYHKVHLVRVSHLAHTTGKTSIAATSSIKLWKDGCQFLAQIKLLGWNICWSHVYCRFRATSLQLQLLSKDGVRWKSTAAVLMFPFLCFVLTDTTQYTPPVLNIHLCCSYSALILSVVCTPGVSIQHW